MRAMIMLVLAWGIVISATPLLVDQAITATRPVVGHAMSTDTHAAIDRPALLPASYTDDACRQSDDRPDSDETARGAAHLISATYTPANREAIGVAGLARCG